MRITFNGEAREVRDALTVAELLRELSLAPKLVAVEINREVVPRGRHDAHVLAEGDEIEVVTLVGGG